jgi:hypothetical protein
LDTDGDTASFWRAEGGAVAPCGEADRASTGATLEALVEVDEWPPLSKGREISREAECFDSRRFKEDSTAPRDRDAGVGCTGPCW